MNKLLNIILIIVFSVFGVTIDSFAQRNVSGVVTDFDGIPMMSVQIREVGTKNHTISDDTGTFGITTMNDDCALSFEFMGFATKTVRITQDTTINVVLEPEALVLISYFAAWLSIGAKYDAINSMIGLNFSNGYDELPLLRDLSFFDNPVYQMNVQTDFNKNYMFSANIGWMIYEFPRRCLLSAGFNQFDYSLKDFFHRDIYVSAMFLKNAALTIKTGYQTQNDHNNLGVSMGFQRPIVYGRSLVGLSAGYYFDYFIYSLHFQGLIRYGISFRLAYDRIDNYDFFNVGLNYFFPRW